MTNSLIRVSRRAMACEFEVCFPAGKCENGTEFALESLDLVESLEGRLSYFRAESEITRINCLAAETPVEVEPALFDLLTLAMRLFEETGGAYDITSTPLWEAWGFARRAGEIPSKTQLDEVRSSVGGQFVELNPAERTIRFRKPGVKINLGSIGKGYALDVCGEHLLARGMTDFLLHGGQSSVLAVGSPTLENGEKGVPLLRRSSVEAEAVPGIASKQAGARDDAQRPGGRDARAPDARGPHLWEVGLADPRQPGRRLAVVRLRDRALGTSGGQFQSFRHRGRRFGHILDARSGWPAEGVLSVTVVAPTAALADALSTAFYVLGPQPSLDYCRARPEIGMFMLCPGGLGGNVETHSVGLDPQDVTMCDVG
jgi:thiamine biosynthesis lipoprotein